MRLPFRAAVLCSAFLWGAQSSAASLPATKTIPDIKPAAAVMAREAPITAPKVWRLKAGRPIHEQIIGWAAQEGWTLQWQPKVSWLAVADTEFEGECMEAVQAVVDGLFFEGKPIRLILWEGNRVAEVVSNDIR